MKRQGREKKNNAVQYDVEGKGQWKKMLGKSGFITLSLKRRIF